MVAHAFSSNTLKAEVEEIKDCCYLGSNLGNAVSEGKNRGKSHHGKVKAQELHKEGESSCIFQP